mgnify:CR=1 FL=1
MGKKMRPNFHGVAKSEIGLAGGFVRGPGAERQFFHVADIGASSKNAI